MIIDIKKVIVEIMGLCICSRDLTFFLVVLRVFRVVSVTRWWGSWRAHFRIAAVVIHV